MKIPSRYLLMAASAAALLLLVVLFAFQEVSRRSIVKGTRFNEQYSGVIQQLRERIDSGQKKMKRNAVTIPAVVVELVAESAARPDPASVQQVFEKDRTFVLQGISWSADKPVVMIEGRNYKTGDALGGFIIQGILPRSIILRDADGALREITLQREEQP